MNNIIGIKAMKWLCSIAVTVALIITFMPVLPLSAQDSPTFTVGPDMIVDSLSAGSSKVYELAVTNYFATDVEVAGLGETPAGAPIAVSNDTSSSSAASWISVDKSQLDPAVAQQLQVTINVPSGTVAGERYASILLQDQGSDINSVTSSILIPILLTVNSSSFVSNLSGQITKISVSSDSTGLVFTGKPIDVLTTLTNTGNCPITDASSSVTIKNSNGTMVFQNTSTLQSPSVLPNYPRVVDTNYNVGLPLGNNYTVSSTITLNNGNVINGPTTSFNVVAPPPIPAAPVLSGPGSSTAPGPMINTLTPTFSWAAIPDASSYNLTISRYPYNNNDEIFSSGPINTTSFTLQAGSIFQGDQYEWQLTATDISGTSPESGLYFYTFGNFPSVNTVVASNVTATAATLNGTLMSLGGASSANVNFEYGTTTAYGSATPTQSLTAGGSFKNNITGLEPNTTYHFRSKAVGINTAYGSDVIFKTPGLVPTITGISPSSGTTGDNIIINGTNFSGVESVSFGGVSATSYTVVDTAEIIAVLGNGNSGTVNVVTATGAANLSGFVFMPSTNTSSTTTTPTQTATTTTQIITSTTPATTTTQTTIPLTSATTAAISRSYAGYFTPEIDESSLTYHDFTNDADSDLNAIAQAGTEVSLTGTNNNGTIIVVQYPSAPQTTVQFSAGGIKGGTGKSAIKFVGLRVEGTTTGTAHVTVSYTDNDVSAYDVNSLILAYFSGGNWHNAGNITISSANDTISGDIPVSRLSGTAIGLGGDLTQTAGVIPNNNQGNNISSTPGVPWAIVGIVMVSIFIVGIIIFIIERNRRKTQANR